MGFLCGRCLGFALALTATVAARGQTRAPGAAAPAGPPATPPPADFVAPAPVDEDAAAFAERDVNQDGWLSGSEAIGFRHYDTNNNGEIDRDEFLAGRAGERLMLREGTVLPEDIDLFAVLDSTGSGYISGVDIERGGVGGFDSDHNGRVTRQEFYDGRARQRREMEERLQAAREAEVRRRLAAGEPEPPPPLTEELRPRKGMMRGRILQPDGQPVPEFTIEIVGYNIDAGHPRIDGSAQDEPNFVGRYTGKQGYYEIRLPDGSFGFAATVTIPTAAGPKRYPLRSSDDRQTIDYIELERSSDGVVKNLIWDPNSSEIKARSTTR